MKNIEENYCEVLLWRGIVKYYCGMKNIEENCCEVLLWRSTYCEELLWRIIVKYYCRDYLTEH